MVTHLIFIIKRKVVKFDIKTTTFSHQSNLPLYYTPPHITTIHIQNYRAINKITR